MWAFEREGEVRLLVDAGLPIDWTEGVAVDKIGVDDFGTNTGALTDCAGRVGVASVGGGDCGGTLLVEGGVRDGRFRISRWVYCTEEGGLRNPALLLSRRIWADLQRFYRFLLPIA